MQRGEIRLLMFAKGQARALRASLGRVSFSLNGQMPSKCLWVAYFFVVGARLGVTLEMSNSDSFFFAIPMRRSASSKYSA